ncbi:RNA-directed DNA polymerase, eukaryota [Tanacetum coccineum]
MGDGNWKSYRSKKDQTQSISQSIFLTNFPDHVMAHDIWKVCNDYGIVVDAFIPYKKSKAERKPYATSHPSTTNERNSPSSYVSILKSGKMNNVMSNQVLPSLILDDSCILDRDFSLSLMGGLWVLIETVSISAKEKLLNHTGSVYWVRAKEMESWDLFICNDSYESESSDDKEDTEDDGLQSRDKVTAINDVERVSESSCMHNNELFYDNNHNNIMPDMDKVLSEDPFNLYDILNKRKDSGDDLKYPPGFTPSVINVEEVNKNVKGATSNKVNEHVNSFSNMLEESVLKGKFSSNNNVCSKRVHTGGSIFQLMDELVKGNSSFNYALSYSLGNSRGLLCVWEPTLFVKYNVTWSDNFLAVMGTWVPSSSKLLIISVYAPQDLIKNRVLWDYILHLIDRWDGDCVIMGDFNEVRTKQERYGLVFNVQGLLASFLYLLALCLDRDLSDHRPILMREHKKFKAIVFKVDFEKAFDSIRLDYLQDILKMFGFGDKWCG